MTEHKNTKDIFFAAANGYNGFRSNFDKIFIPEEYEKIYVIKGGPGTGKSTLMRRISNVFSGKLYSCEILCSSDPKSLDGLILQINNKKIAILDGTSPHVYEPKYIGAVEEIINLGAYFDYSSLKRNKDEIVKLSCEKKRNYDQAYFELSICGKIRQYIYNIFDNMAVYNSAEINFNEYIKEYNTENQIQQSSPYLFGSFSKNGYQKLDIPVTSKRIVSISGDGMTEHYLMSRIHDHLLKNKLGFTSYESPLSSSLFDVIETDSTIFATTDKNEGIDSSKSITLKKFSDDYFNLTKMYSYVLSRAKDSFNNAAINHFALESIYSANVDFSGIEDITSTIITDINYVLS